MQSYDNDQHPQQLNDALTEPSSVQAPQAPSSKQDASPPLKQDKTQLKLKRKKNLHEAEKHKLLDAADTSVTPAAQEDEPADIQDQQSAGRLNATHDSRRFAKPNEGAEEGPGLAQDNTAELTEPGRVQLAANTLRTQKTATEVSAPLVMYDPSSEVAALDEGAESLEQSASVEKNGGGEPNWALAGLALLGFGIAHGGGGGGHHADKQATAPIITQTTINGVVMAGLVLPGAGLSVKAYSLDGKELGSSAVNDKGEYSIVMSGEYNGTVKLVLVDGNGNANDYWNEASGPKDVGELSAIANIKAGHGNSIMMTSLTNMAAEKLAGQTPSASQVNAVNQAVAKLFGLDDILVTAPVPVVTNTGADNLSHAND
ncbi:hypothetical protein [Methylobacillus glycogenes]|uniref:hypothetical protein n=1 Tax=Methylobacillus glycogenes TaxID=406 RepID=UPI000A7ACDFE|nr:hypothetical protein [Methylobacillus glycogenes]